MTLTANGRALRVLFVDAAARRTVLAKLLYDGFLSVRKFPSDCRCALAQKQLGPIRKNGHKNTTVRVHRGLTVIQLPAGAFRVLSEHHNNLAQPADVAERHPHHRYLGRIVRRIYGR